MSLSTPFIRRPVATTLLTIGLALAGLFAFQQLPVSPLPQVDFPTISVFASMPGASPETMATTVATPLERHLGVIAGVTEITSSSSVGSSRMTLQFDLSRNIDGAARDVQAAINAARADLPTALRATAGYRVDGHETRPAIGSERGVLAVSSSLELPAGSTRTIVVDLREPATSPGVRTLVQPAVYPTKVSASVTGCGG